MFTLKDDVSTSLLPNVDVKSDYKTNLSFYLNDEEITINNPNPSLMLVDYLRSNDIGMTGTKKACGQGGCGACTVMLSSYDDKTDEIKHRSINSCMHPLAALDGMKITTVEGLLDSNGALSPIQYAVAKNNGSQCGYCTPGFVMNMHSFMLSQKEVPTKIEIENAFDGNICRCTGFRPILHAMKSFACDWSTEDEVGTMETFIDPLDNIKHYKNITSRFPESLKKPIQANHFSSNTHHWYRPVNTIQLTSLVEHYSESPIKYVHGNTSVGVYDKYVDNPQVLLDISQLKNIQHIDIATENIHVGSGVTYTEFLDALTSSINDRDENSCAVKNLNALKYMVQRTAGMIVRNAASLAGNTMLVIKHLQGNLPPFPSDAFTALVACNASVKVFLPYKAAYKTYDLLEFAYEYNNKDKYCETKNALIIEYIIPLARKNEYVETYKCAQRKVNSHSIVNAGFRMLIDENSKIEDVACVFGGIGPVAFHAEKLESFLTGKSLTLKSYKDAEKELVKDIRENIASWKERMSRFPDEGYSDSYKIDLAKSFLYKFVVYLLNVINPAVVPAEVRTAGIRHARPVSWGTQKIQTYANEFPVSKPYIKEAAFRQAMGVAKYTHDIAIPARGLESAIVTSQKAKASFLYRIPDASDSFVIVTLDVLIKHLKETYSKFVDYITYADIPPSGTNQLGSSGVNNDPVFAEGEVHSFGQCIGLVVAQNEQSAIDIAHYIATSCIVFDQYDKNGNFLDPLLTIDDALAVNSVFPDIDPYPTHIWKITRQGSQFNWADNDSNNGDESVQSTCNIVNGRQEAGSQLYFYMETQSCVIEPMDNERFIVHASTQTPRNVQESVAKVLGLSCNQIDVRVKQLGGAYGGKTTRPPWFVTPVAIAAYKLGRAVRLATSRETDSAMVGKRHPFRGDYKIAIVNNPEDQEFGKLKGIQTQLYSNGGATYDCSFVIMDVAQLRMDNAYMIPNYQTTGDVCKTNITTNGAFRSVGAIQACLIQEEALENAAHSIGLSPEGVREKNLYKLNELTPYGQKLNYCYMRESWDYALQSSNYMARKKKIAAFNQQNKWKKRGISIVPIKYAMGYNASFLEQGGALIEVYQTDGTLLIRHGGVEMGQGIMTKISQVASLALNVPLNLIRFGETDTAVVPNPISTGASTGTALNGGAVKDAAEQLRHRLEQFCFKMLNEKGASWCHQNGIDYWEYDKGWQTIVDGKLIWNNIVSLCFHHRINLSSQSLHKETGGTQIDSGLSFKAKAGGGYYTEEVDSFVGYTYSVGVTEVEVDILTGETDVLRADLYYDMGKSINPAIDIGQIEGAYIQGLGYILTEELVFEQTGENKGNLNSLNTWAYKPPAAQTIPIEMNVDLIPRENASLINENPNLLLSSKEVGEPPLMMAASAFFAVKHAILSAREEQGMKGWFEMKSPANVQEVLKHCPKVS